MFLKIQYFSNSNNGICADDFSNKLKSSIINKNHILSISDLLPFYMPFSNTFKSNYSVLIMSNNDKFYLLPDNYNRIIKSLNYEEI